MDELELTALLQEAEEHAPDEGELHRLSVLFHHRGPAPSTVTEWLAGLVRGGAPAPVAVRSPAEPRLFEYQAGPCRILLEARPRVGETVVDLHGQLVAEDLALQGGSVVVSWGDGSVATAEVDEFGEFDLRGVGCAVCTASWHLGSARIVLPELALDGAGCP